MLRPITTLDLPAEIRTNLLSNGFRYLEDIPPDNEHFSVVQQLSKPPRTITALEAWKNEVENDYISTSSKALDGLLNGGFQCGYITQLSGQPGSGKTQICSQICVSVQLSKTYNGLNASAIYIDTRSGLSKGRIEDLVVGARKFHKDKNITIDQILKGISVFSPTTLKEFFDIVKKFNDFLKSNPRIRLLVIDSLSFLVQCGCPETIQRTTIYFEVITKLQELLLTHKIAIVVVNELANHIDSKGEYSFASAGGQLLAHRVNTRILLTRLKNTVFIAHCWKSSNLPQTSIYFEITPDGIRDTTLSK